MPVPRQIVNHSRPSEWLKAYVEETPNLDCIISKREVYNDYRYFCEQSCIRPLVVQVFGKLMKKLFPNLMHIRIRRNKRSKCYYAGLRKIYNKPNLLHFLTNKPKPQCSETKEVAVTENDDNNRSFELDGITFSVYDPLSLLSLSTKNEISRRRIANKNSSNPTQSLEHSAVNEIMLTSKNERVEIPKKIIICCICGDEYPRERSGLHVMKHLKCKTCNRKLKNLGAALKHFTRHCDRGMPDLKLPRIDTVESVVKRYPNAFDANAMDGALFKANTIIFSATSKSNTTSIINAPRSKRRRCRYSKKVSIYSESKENQALSVDELKNTIKGNINKILVLSNNVPTSSTSSMNVVHGRVSMEQPSSIHSTSITNRNLNDTNVQQPLPLMQIVEDSTSHTSNRVSNNSTETTNNQERETNGVNNTSAKGLYKIRVKTIQELS